jgi:CRISPR-associated protein Csd1
MSFVKLFKDVYDKNAAIAGKNVNGYVLMPVGFVTNNCSFEIAIDQDGNFLSFDVLGKNEAPTLMASSEKSAARTSTAIAPYPGCTETLMYLIGDMTDLPITEADWPYKNLKFKGNEAHHEAYMNLLRQWAEFPGAPSDLSAILTYLENDTIADDIVASYGDALMDKNGGPKKRAELVKCYTRINVINKNDEISVKTWEKEEYMRSFAEFLPTLLTDSPVGTCSVTGERNVPLATLGRKKLRGSWDGCTLFPYASSSMNSLAWFGKHFKESIEVFPMGYITFQKAINAMIWLFARQAFTINGMSILICKKDDGSSVIDAFNDTEDLFGEGAITEGDTGELFADRVRKACFGSKQNLTYNDSIVVMVVDNVVHAKKGREAVLYYQEINPQRFINNVVKWHEESAWAHLYGKKKFVGTPNTMSVARLIYPLKDQDAQRQAIIKDLFKCIIFGYQMPKNVMDKLFDKAINPLIYRDENRYVMREKAQAMACSYIRKHYCDKKEDFGMALNTTTTDRSYLFGRLFAILEREESYANFLGGNDREASNVLHQMSSYVYSPATIYAYLFNEKLVTYREKIMKLRPGTGAYYEGLRSEILETLEEVDGFNNDTLEPSFLLGYNSQKRALKNASTSEDTKEKTA